MTATVADIIDALENWAPSSLAEDWDNVGLQVGSPKKEVKRLGLCLDLTPQTLKQAVTQKVDCLVTHHPLIFKPLKNLSFDSWQAALIRDLIKHDIAFVAAHTNLDSARNGVSEILASLLHLKIERALLPSPGASLFRVSVYLPKGYEEEVRKLILETEAGVRGAYRGCSFTVEGQGSFYPLAEANPALGERGKLNLVSESKIEFVAPALALPRILSLIKEKHPYEEVPIDVIPLRGHDFRFGLGRVGELPISYTLFDLARKVGEVLDTQDVFVVGEPQRLVKRVALCAGAGGDLLKEALRQGAEVYITAEIKYHQAREAEASGLGLISVGHFESERVVIPEMARYFRTWADDRGCSLEISALEEKSPFLRAF